MKICYLANAKSIHIQRWLKYFADNGHEVHLISQESFGDCNIENVKLHLLKRLRPQMRFISFPANLFFEVIQVRRLIKKINPDIVHAHYIADYGFHGALSGFQPFVVSAWGSDVLRTPKGKIKSKVTRYSVTYALKKADAITTTAEFMKEYIIKKFTMSDSNKIVRIPWGIDLKIFYRGYDDEVKIHKESLEIIAHSPILISNRGMDPKYEIGNIIEAIPHVLESHSDAIFVFIRGYGSSKFEDKMKSKAKKLGVADNIRFISRLLTPKEMAVYLNMADVLISIPKTDQFGSSIMEGMACGVIPIVSNIGVYKEYLTDGDTAFFAKPDNPEEISEKIIYCIEHPELKEKFYKINRKIIEEKEDWNKKAKKMEELYENLLRGTIQK
ncbi:Glycosyltransferase involved in cell wall bisynthesis [Candidatus Methanophagaceae archaeon]|nr:Glycosyltransferase involved in cell wall bisynthesis [Methanophagales archaeon]